MLLDVLLFLYSATLVMWLAGLTHGFIELRRLLREIDAFHSRQQPNKDQSG